MGYSQYDTSNGFSDSNNDAYTCGGLIIQNGEIVYTRTASATQIKFQTSTTGLGTWADVTVNGYPSTFSHSATGPWTATVDDAATIWISNNGQIARSFPSPQFQYYSASSGPTVTSITVSNQNSATRSFTVAHTGTLSTSDINYHIDEVDITSLGSPNTPITNLQTTTNGSTFDSYVLANFGTHSIEIGSQLLQFFVAASQTSNVTDLSNYTVVFPTTVSGWHATYGPPYFSTCTIDTNDVRFDYNDTSGVNIKRNTLILSTNYRHSSNASTRGYYYQHSTYEYNTATFDELTAGYIDPVALQTSTGSPNTTFSLSGNLLPGLLVNTYYWDFATYTAPPSNPPVNDAQATTTSDGGSKRRRYPIISTNLFDRQRSIFSIGMTHKDETLF